ncbi:MAG: isoprenoid biosynthesis glyoxalase ElbB [Rickettsia endosymbiont of Bryobia graminum]|nr:isoprenoid biosynthesis glyoxalase ElbB [Rickettsia endosymbiont of Bryobia graminum]
MKNVVVILSGCGYLDGSEIFEAVFTLLELDKHKVNVRIFAPNKNQHYAMNHLSQKEVSEQRNILVESARIARGKIEALEHLKAEDFDALILPGGYGAGLNLSDIALQNEKGVVLPELQEIIIKFYKLSKPIGAMCFAPTVVAAALRNHTKITITLGNANDLISALGANEEICKVQDIVIDKTNKIVTTPAFMLDAPISEIHIGIHNLVNKVLEM